MKKIARGLVPLFGLAALLWYLRPSAAVPVEDYHIAMGTMVRVALYVDEDQAPALLDLARTSIADVEAVMSHHDSSSELSWINRVAADRTVDVSPLMATMLDHCWQLAVATKGDFDPALGALTALWGFPDARRPPAAADIAAALALSGRSLVEWGDGRIHFRRAGVRLDLGAAAKGFAVDQAVARLQEAGVSAGMIEAGGDIRFWGIKPDGRPWRFGVQHPRDLQRTVVVDDIGLPALATSGDYEQVFEFEGRRYHHLLDPGTGLPARRAVSATVWAESAATADMLATAAFVAGPQGALEMAAANNRLEVLVFYEDAGTLRHVASAGVRAHIHSDDKAAASQE